MQEEEQNNQPQGEAPLPAPQEQHPLQRTDAAGQQLRLAGRDGKDGGGSEEQIDLRHYWHVLLRRKWTVISTVGIVFFAVLVGSLLKVPIYRASTTIQIDRDAVKVVDGQDETGAWADEESFYNTQYELLRSPALSQRVAAELHLANDPNYKSLQQGSALSRLIGLIVPGKKQPVQALASDADSAALGGYVNGNLDIEAVRNTHLVQINVDSASGQLAAKIANSLADNFIAQNIEHSFNASAYARKYLEGRLTQLKQKLGESQTQLVEIATREKIMVDSDGKSTLAATDLTSLATELAQAQDERSKAEARWKLTSATPGENLPADMFANSIIGQLRQSRAEVVADYQKKLITYEPNYPLMKSIKDQIDEMDRQIKQEYANVKASERSEYTSAVSHEALLQKQMDVVKQQMFDEQHRSIAYAVLLRDVSTNQALYDALLQRYKTIGIEGGVASNNISVVDRAAVPGAPYKPDLRQNLTLALIFGLALGAALALLFEHLDDTLKSPSDVESHLKLAVLGVIPKLKNLSPTEAFKDVRSPFSEAYRSVRTALQFTTGSGVPRTLLVTSATPGDGKSTTALVLARNFAQLGKRVLLIDADLRNPSMHRQVGLENDQGLSNVLSGLANPHDVIRTLPDSELQVMTAGPLPPNPAELLAGAKMLSLLTVAMAKYDQIVIDSPPTLGLADATILAHIAKGTLLVVNAGATRRDVAVSAVKRLRVARAHLVGALLTKYDAQQSGYGYGYGYGSYSYYTYEGDQPKLEQK